MKSRHFLSVSGHNAPVHQVVGLPGGGSTPEFMARAFPFLDWVIDYRTIALGDVISSITAASPQVLVGVSIGAHLSVVAASHLSSLDGLILVAPAWTREPDPRHAVLADAVLAEGVSAQVRRLPKEPAWVREEVTDAWQRYEQVALGSHLQEVAGTPGPGLDRLRALQVPCVVVGFWDDPVHPWQVARTWAHAIPVNRLIGLPIAALADDRANVAQLAWRNLRDLVDLGRDLHSRS